MKQYTLGFIGMGNMAGAIAGGIIDQQILDRKDICFYDPSGKNVLGLAQASNNKELAAQCRHILLAVKPNQIDSVLTEICAESENKAIGSIAAGVDLQRLQRLAPKARLLRIMPNTCAQIGKSYTCLNSDHMLTEQEFDLFHRIFSALGQVLLVEEGYFNVCAAVCSCGVAFGHMLVESMADGGVVCGMNKAKSVEMAAWAILGACEMILKSNKTPMELKDQICSPGGMTAKAMQALENGGFRGDVIGAIEAAYQKGKSM